MTERKHDPGALSIIQAQAAGAESLRSAGVIDPRLDAGSLLARALRRDRTYVITHGNEPVTGEQLDRFRVLIARRAAREPLQYIIGYQEFFKLSFAVTPDVLIPRPETELIVEAALELADRERSLSILDVGTGSGCIVISLLHELKKARAMATDISPKALEVARRNAQRHNVSDRVTFMQADSLAPLTQPAAFSLIVSNPPYIPAGEIATLQREVREHEPITALASGADGLDHIRALLRETPRVLHHSGYFIFEIGFGQSDAIDQLVDRAIWHLIEVRKDLQGIPRTVVLQKR
ncbi:MAG TPA: peptide chain release factor N(5)-glutamine methyltransferase [Pyrinomonadaceae bacterium]